MIHQSLKSSTVMKMSYLILSFIEVFRKSDSISGMTDGAFDITVGPLVRAWGFGPDEHKNFTEENRDSLLKLVGL